MRSVRTNQLALLVLALGVVAFAVGAGGAALAQDHGAAHDQTEKTADKTTDKSKHGEAYDHATDGEHASDPYGEHQTDTHGEEHGDAHGGAHGDDHGESHGAMPHLPNALTFIKQWVPAPVAAKLDAFLDPIFSLTMALILSLFFIALSKKLDPRKPGRTQMAVEMILGGLYSLFETIIGPSARRYTPYLGSLFIFIFCNNLFGLIPLGHAATSSFANTTFALGGMTFLYVQGIALKENGIGGYLHHMAGSPKTGMDWGFALLLFPLHLLGELIKPVSLSLRLFGNIFGEDTLVATMVLLGAGISFGLTGNNFVPGLPLQFPFYFLGLLSSTIQALVFTLLATVYIALWLPHGDHGDHAKAHGH